MPKYLIKWRGWEIRMRARNLDALLEKIKKKYPYIHETGGIFTYREDL
jgi:hypothetical protein